MNDSIEDRLREAVKADGRPLSELAKLARIGPDAMSRFVKDGSSMRLGAGLTLAEVVGFAIGTPIETTREIAVACCECAKPLTAKSRCEDCQAAKSRNEQSSPGTSLARVNSDPPPRGMVGGPSVKPIASNRPKLTAYERERNRKMGMFVPDA